MYHIAISASNQQVFPIRRDDEIAWMNPCQLVACFRQHSVIRVNTEYGNTICFQTIAGIQEFTIRADMNIRTRRNVKKFLEGLSSGSSSLLKNVTGGYHYHTIEAESEEILDDIQNELAEKGFLAKLQDYEPVDFWGEEESNTNV